MAYYDNNEHESRIVAVQNILHQKNLDFALIYYDEYNLGNGWYLTAWCPQFESGTVLVPARGKPMILGGPESEPFAKQDSAVKETRNLPVFMALLLHQIRAGHSQLYPGKSMDCVVNTAVARAEASEHLAVCRIDDGVAVERCNIALPKVQIFL